MGAGHRAAALHQDQLINVSFKLFGTIGNQSVERYVNYGIPNDNYWDWQLGATATVWGVDLTVAYTDTNIDVCRLPQHLKLRRPRHLLGQQDVLSPDALLHRPWGRAAGLLHGPSAVM